MPEGTVPLHAITFESSVLITIELLLIADYIVANLPVVLLTIAAIGKNKKLVNIELEKIITGIPSFSIPIDNREVTSMV